MSQPVIELNQISKRYVLHKQKPFIAKEFFHRVVLRRDRRDIFWALNDVSLNIHAGETVAFIGHNGAGKSTLLSIITGTTKPTFGSRHINGRIGAMLELGAGFHPDLTGRENIYLNASLLGFDEKKTHAEFDSILAFSGLGEFIDVPLCNYSSGMQVRLGFSVAIHMDPDILIMDEVFAVGDQEFQAKCFKRIKRFRDDGKTLLFVSHNLASLKDICARVVWLDHGRILADDTMSSIMRSYQQPSTKRRPYVAGYDLSAQASEEYESFSGQTPKEHALEKSHVLAHLDVLVFSSHETATEAILNTLLPSGVKVRHCHLPFNIDLTESEFVEAADYYHARNSKPLRIISVFREPFSRLTASFFQSLRTNFYAHTRYIDPDQNQGMIARAFDRSMNELVELFLDYIRVVDGFGESLEVMSRLFNFSPSEIGFEPDSHRGVRQFEHIELFTFRYDQLTGNFDILGDVPGIDLSMRREKSKLPTGFQSDLYQAFESQLKLEASVIREIYARRKELIDVFYPGAYEHMLAAQLDRYARPETPP